MTLVNKYNETPVRQALIQRFVPYLALAGKAHFLAA